MEPAAGKRAGQRNKSIEEVVTYAVSHRIRVQILILLNESTYTAGELADLIDEPKNKIGNHLHELVEAGSIEIADTNWHPNFAQHRYRAVKTPYYSDEEIAAMTPEHRQITYGLVIQTLLAEIMASFWAGKIRDDPRSWVASNWLNLDTQGRLDVADEQERSWQRLEEIQRESLNRVAVSGEKTISHVVGQVGFERARTSPKPGGSANGD